MAELSINQPASLINHSPSLISLQERIWENLAKAEALTKVALSEDFSDFSDSTVHDYLWVLNDLIGYTRLLNENALDILIKDSKA
jgi:hypothetical protein